MTQRTATPAPGTLGELLAAQHGVVTRAQAVRLGLSTDMIDRRLAARRWIPVHPRVYRDADHPGGDASRVRAAVLWAGEGAVLTGAAAAWWWGLVDAAPDVVTVTVPRRRAPRSRAGVQVRRRELDPADVTVHGGLAVAAPAAAVLEAALELSVGEDLLLRVLTRAGGAAPDLAAITTAHARNAGAHGAARIGRMLDSVIRQAAAHAGHRLRGLLIRDGLTGWCADHEIAGVVLPLAFPAARVALEVRGGPAGCGDRWRQAVLRRHGWRVVVVELTDPWRRPGATVAALRCTLADRPEGPGGGVRAAG